jgi:hypothetical protein
MRFKKDRSHTNTQYTFFQSPLDNLSLDNPINSPSMPSYSGNHHSFPDLSSYNPCVNNELISFENTTSLNELQFRRYRYTGAERPKSSEEDKIVASHLTF